MHDACVERLGKGGNEGNAYEGNTNEGNANNNEDSRQPPHNEAWKEGMCRTVLTNHIYVKTQRDRVAIKKDNCWRASVSDQNITACALSSSRFILNNPLGLDVL